MKAIGGFFELELNKIENSHYHSNVLALNTGRNAFEHILLANNIKHISIPFYTCDVILEPLRRNQISYSFYSINEDFSPNLDESQKGNTILYTNYFGLNQNNVYQLSRLVENTIIDNSQSFFDKPLLTIPTFYSPRKFFGISDGGYAINFNNNYEYDYERDYSFKRVQHLLQRIEDGPEKSYNEYLINESDLNNQPIKYMSKLTQKILQSVNYDKVKSIRQQNFRFLHSNLKHLNRLSSFIESSNFEAPMNYPFWVNDGAKVRDNLLKKRIYIPYFWKNVINTVSKNQLEYDFSENIVFLPIDQRYDMEEMNKLLMYI
jgi:hypothetical protein